VTAVLAEIGAASANQSVGIWSLQVSADGSVLSLVAQSDSGPVQLVCAQVSWQAGGWHCLVVNYDPTGIALGLDDQWVAQSTATLVIPPAAGVLALGSTLTGNASAGGDIEEFRAYVQPLDPEGLTRYYNALAQQTALGPISREELEAMDQAIAAELAAQSLAQSGSPRGGGGPLWPEGEGGDCVTNGSAPWRRAAVPAQAGSPWW
jgi:hypothetical protein